MNRTRRIAVVLSATAAVLFGSMVPAGAQFSNSASAPTMAISSVDVQPPTSVSTGGTKCSSTYDATTGTWTTTLNARVSWTGSASRGVTGYVVTAYFTDGSKYPVVWVNAPATSVSGNYDAYYATQNIRVTVTTYTSYGWTEESALSGVIRC